MFRLHIIRPQLDVVMVAKDRESALKQGIYAISSDHNTRPPNIRPLAIFLGP
jgi:hypothetical protein